MHCKISIMCIVHILLFYATVFDVARCSTLFDAKLSHALITSGSETFEEESSITRCGLKCLYHVNCVAFDICEIDNNVRCTFIQNLTSFISNASPSNNGECRFYTKRDHPLFACNNGGTWSSETGRCECQPSKCGDWCENTCTTVTSVTTVTTDESTTVTSQLTTMTTAEETTVNEACPSSLGYTLLANPLMCYKVNTVRSTWPVANTTCVAEGGMLLMLHTEDRWDYWNQNAPSIDDLTYGFWVGGNDIAVEGQWVWSDGSLFTDHAFTKWGRMYHGVWINEPDNYGGQDNCLRFYKAVHPNYPAYPETEYTWHDDWCEGSTLYFICEIAMN